MGCCGCSQATRASKAFAGAVADSRTSVLVSAVCVWEPAIKSALGKLRVPDDLPERLAEFAFERPPVTDAYVGVAPALPTEHHDPFDRLLAAQALCERATIVSMDAIFDAYRRDAGLGTARALAVDVTPAGFAVVRVCDTFSPSTRRTGIADR